MLYIGGGWTARKNVWRTQSVELSNWLLISGNACERMRHLREFFKENLIKALAQ
jgi:hypothetical protein